MPTGYQQLGNIRSSTPSRSNSAKRRSTLFVTLGFIAASAVFHVLMGGLVRPVHFYAQPQPSVTQLQIVRFETPPPTPHPKPRQSPLAQHVRAHIAAPHVATEQHTKVQARHPMASPLPLAQVAPVSNSPAPLPDEEQPQPAASATPADYRYVIISARFLHREAPDYPATAAEQGEEGTAIVLLTAGPDGISDLRVWESSGYPELDRAALLAAKESTYLVPEVNDEPAIETYRIIYTFSIGA